MKKEIPTQLIVGLGILVVGAAIAGGEYALVKWMPRHKAAVRDETLKPIPYRNDRLGIDLQVASGFYGRVEEFAGGVRIERPKFWSIGPTVTITSQPNPDGTSEFDPKLIAKWETAGIYEELPQYRFSRTRINNRDAVLMSQYRGRSMVLTTRVISPERIIEIDCSPGKEDETLYLDACNETVHSLKIAGPEPAPLTEPVVDLTPAARKGKDKR